MSNDRPIPGLHVAVLAFNSMRTIEPCLASVAGLAERVLVIDSGSTDGTIERCRAAGAVVVHRRWEGMVAQRQFAIDSCAAAAGSTASTASTWVLLLDSDESVEPRLAAAMREALDHRVADDIGGFEVNRKLWFRGGWLNHAFQPEWRLRLVRPRVARASGRPPHDAVETTGRVLRLSGDLRHDSWADAGEMLERMAKYARTGAEHGEDLAGGGTLRHILTSPAAAFLKQYTLRGGFLDGWRGAVCSAGAAAGTLMKHVCLMERRKAPRPPTTSNQ